MSECEHPDFFWYQDCTWMECGRHAESVVEDFRDEITALRAQLADCRVELEHERKATLDEYQWRGIENQRAIRAEKECDALRAQLAAAQENADRYRWLRDLPGVSVFVQRDEHKCYYVSAAESLTDQHMKDAEASDEFRARMIATDTIWTLQVYPVTPVGFELSAAPTLDDLIDAARKEVDGG